MVNISTPAVGVAPETIGDETELRLDELRGGAAVAEVEMEMGAVILDLLRRCMVECCEMWFWK